MYIVHHNGQTYFFFNRRTAEKALSTVGFQEKFPKDMSAEQYRIYDTARQTICLGDCRSLNAVSVKFVTIFFNNRDEYAVLFKERD